MRTKAYWPREEHHHDDLFEYVAAKAEGLRSLTVEAVFRLLDSS